MDTSSSQPERLITKCAYCSRRVMLEYLPVPPDGDGGIWFCPYIGCMKDNRLAGASRVTSITRTEPVDEA